MSEITVREAGRRGGEACRERHGKEHYAALSAKGAKRRSELVARGREIEAEDGAKRKGAGMPAVCGLRQDSQ